MRHKGARLGRCALLVATGFILLGVADAWAHAGEDHGEPAGLMSGWTWDPLLTAGLVASALLYAVGVYRLWRRAGAGKGLRPWEVVCFLLSWVTLIVALLSPLDRLSDILFSAHMGQHELLMLVAAPLMVLGKPLVAYLWAVPERARKGAGGLFAVGPVHKTWRILTGPLLVLVLHGLARWVWHLPVLYEAALRSEAVHALQHAMFFGTAALFWWTLVHGRYGRAGYGVAVFFVFATAAHTGLLGALITFSKRLWYPLYAERASRYGVDALQDQQLAGLLMWVPAGALFMLLGVALFAAWMGELERRALHASPRRTSPVSLD